MIIKVFWERGGGVFGRSYMDKDLHESRQAAEQISLSESLQVSSCVFHGQSKKYKDLLR